jgi:glycolate oxidase
MVERSAEMERMYEDLEKVLGEARVKRVPKSPNKLIVKPKTADDVSRITKLASKRDVPIVPKREMFWFAIDKTSERGLLILDTSNMNGIFEIDEENLIVTVGPGVQWKDLYNILFKRGYLLGAYPGVSISTAGEWINKGGGGIGSYKYGSAADQVRSMEVVLPDGKIINTGFKTVLSNSSGYNLNGLFVGSDSTLGVITKITLKLYPAPEEIKPLYYTVPESFALTEIIHDLTHLKTTPLNISFFGINHLKSLRLFGKEVPELEDPLVMNITLAGLKSVVEYDEVVIDEVMNKQMATKLNNDMAEILWNERFFMVPITRAGVIPVLCEVFIPANNLLFMINDTYTLIDKMDLKGAIMGTLCDRSTVALTPYYLSGDRPPKKSKLAAAFMNRVGELALRHGGRPAGSGAVSPSDLRRIYGEGINTLLNIKSALDPHDIMNPSRLL